jgi:hypothetical protein
MSRLMMLSGLGLGAFLTLGLGLFVPAVQASKELSTDPVLVARRDDDDSARRRCRRLPDGTRVCRGDDRFDD